MRFGFLGQNSRPVLMYTTVVSYCRFSVPGAVRSKACVCGLSLVEDCGFESFRGHECLSVLSVCDGPITRPEESYRMWSVWVNVNVIIIVHLWLMKTKQRSNASLIATFSKVIVVILMLKFEVNMINVASQTDSLLNLIAVSQINEIFWRYKVSRRNVTIFGWLLWWMWLNIMSRKIM